MKIAITGASGFLGTYIMKHLDDLGKKATYSYRDKLKSNIFKNHKAVLLNIDEYHGGEFSKLGSPDIVLHLAWGGLPNYSSDKHLKNELPKQIKFLEGLINQGLKSLVVTGTCFEYGMQEGELKSSSPTRPSNPYGCAKDLLRQKLQDLQVHKDFNLTWARLFYMYGIGQSKKSLYPLLLNAVKKGDKVFKMSSGEQVRDFMHVEEVARKLIDISLNNPNSGVINICSGNPVKIKDLVNYWIKENNWSIKPKLGVYPIPEYEPFEFWGGK